MTWEINDGILRIGDRSYNLRHFGALELDRDDRWDEGKQARALYLQPGDIKALTKYDLDWGDNTDLTFDRLRSDIESFWKQASKRP